LREESHRLTLTERQGIERRIEMRGEGVRCHAPTVAVDEECVVALEMARPPAELFGHFTQERRGRRLIGFKVSAEEAPLACAGESRLVVAQLQEQAAVLRDDQSDGDLAAGSLIHVV
jgi:hypothetical protein